MRSHMACRCALIVAAVVLACAAGAQQGAGALVEGGAELLNSDRIEAAFGSYGIEVLSSDALLRVSNLYSLHDGEPTTRTFAVVRYPAKVDEAFAGAHAEILGGGSIGATFRANGWQVIKTHRHFGEIPSSPRVERMMRLDGRMLLALHIYVLEIVNGTSRFQYATIAEVHHPDYLSRAGVTEIYAPGWTGTDGAQLELVAETVSLVAARML